MLAAYLISFLIGYLSIRLILDKDHTLYSNNDFYMHYVLSLPIGLGISSLISFYLLLLFSKANSIIFLSVHLLFLLVLLILNNKRKRLVYDVEAIRSHQINIKWLVIIGAILLFILFQAFPHFVCYPYGTWDAISCWNLRARFILMADNWLRAFSPLMWAVDYPILLPLTVIWGWLLGGYDSTVCPIFVAIFYSLSIILFIFVSLNRYYGPKKSLLALLVFINIPTLLGVITSQYADIVLSCYNLIGAVLCFIGIREERRDYMILGQASLGFSLFTKSEGLLFFVCINFIMLGYFLIKKRVFVKIFLQSTLASFLSLLTLVIFKGLIHSPQKMFSSFTEISPVLFYKKVKEFLLFILGYSFKINIMALFWCIFLASFVFFRKKIFSGERLIIILTTLIVFLGYFLAYILRIESTVDHLRFAVSRFTMHLVPLLCFLIADVTFDEG